MYIVVDYELHRLLGFFGSYVGFFGSYYSNNILIVGNGSVVTTAYQNTVGAGFF